MSDDPHASRSEALRRAFLDHLVHSLGKHPAAATRLDRFTSLALAVRDRLVERRIATEDAWRERDAKRVYYLSAEFLLGRALRNNLVNLGLWDDCRRALAELDIDADALLEEEPDPGLGNGGLGRLAACFLDSLATLGYPACGHGIRYEFGIFHQLIKHGHQLERPDDWLRYGNPWELVRPEAAVEVQLYGRVEEHRDARGSFRQRWVDGERVLGIPYDTPIAGYLSGTVNTLRLWGARASEELDLDLFHQGDYLEAVARKNDCENLSRVLYPNDTQAVGRELRLKQQYFFVACSMQDIVRRHLATHDSFDTFPDKVAVQLNDTHPSIAVAELMRLLVDVHDVPWDRAFSIVERTFGYTNHTLLAEGLERWPVSLFERVLPRHVHIIYRMNQDFLGRVLERFPGDWERAARMSLIEEGPVKQVRMAHLATLGSHKVNGVAALHSDLVRDSLLADFSEMSPEKFTNKTNGITPRRWLLSANPALAALVTEHIGDGWVKNLDELERLAPLADDPDFRARFSAIKRANKESFAAWAGSTLGIDVDARSMFDVQVKRIHEYKRQLLDALHVVALYLRAKRDPSSIIAPRTVLIGGKAAPGYQMAKIVIHFCNEVARVVREDPDVKNLSLVFLPNYRVSLAERIIPAADLSEQISTAGKEASGTGNMKLALNGALTIGTYDGANIEIREAVGAENFFLFGLHQEEIEEAKARGYRPRDRYEADPELRAVLDLVASGFFSHGDETTFAPIVEHLLETDTYMLMADFRSYVDCQERVARAFLDEQAWTRAAILNVARVGRFSSDRTIREYADEIWGIEPVPVPIAEP